MFTLTSQQKSFLVKRFRDNYPDFRSFSRPGSLGKEELEYKRKALDKWEQRMGTKAAEKALSRNGGLEVLQALKATVATNIVSYHSWERSFGQNPDAIAEILWACLAAARRADVSLKSIAPVFEAAGKHGLKLDWDALSVVLWAFNPSVFFPIKISYYRGLAEELGWELPAGRPDPDKFVTLMKFAEPFWELCRRWKPQDATDMQSAMWGMMADEESEDEEPDGKNRQEGTGISSPFNLFFKGLRDANPKLDVMKRVITRLQAGGSERDSRLVTTFRPSKGSKLRFIFGNWVIFSYRMDGYCQLLLRADDPKGLEGIQDVAFQEPINGVSYALTWLPPAALDDDALWEKMEEALDAVRQRFSHWNKSNYASSHYENLFRLIMEPAERPRILREGLAQQGVTDLPERAAWLLAPGEGGEIWNQFFSNGEATIGWNDTGDLAGLVSPEDFKQVIRDCYPKSGPAKVGKMLRDFAVTMAPGDLVFAKMGVRAVLGYGIVESAYVYEPNTKPFVHVRKVKWVSKERCEMPPTMRLPVQTLSPIDRRPELMEVLSEFYDLGPITPPLPNIYTKQDALADLFMPEEKLDTIIESLKRKKNIILQGAPGTGKTFVARRLAYLLMGVPDETRAPMVQFHQSTCYEDFIQGYRPDGNGGFELKDGAFYTFCQDAINEPDKSFVFIIDEINRGNLSRIFGELMMLIEPDKRDESFAVPLTYATSREETFHVPENVFLIGTMNTADRSLSMVDYALRRRFAFIEAEPGFSSPAFVTHLTGRGASSKLVAAIQDRMETINTMITNDSTNLGRGYRIGHSFFVPAKDTKPDAAWYGDIVRHEILPLIEEYWIDDGKARAAATNILLQPIES